jgi:hypothetical protein
MVYDPLAFAGAVARTSVREQSPASPLDLHVIWQSQPSIVEGLPWVAYERIGTKSLAMTVKLWPDLAMGMGNSIGYHFLSPWVPSRAIFAGYSTLY